MKPYYQHAGITIYHGDCREVLPQLDKAQMVLTDPPYEQNKGTWDVRPQGFVNLLEESCDEAILWFGKVDDIPQPNYRVLIWHLTMVSRSAKNFQADFSYSWQPIFYRKGQWASGEKCAMDVLKFHTGFGTEPCCHPTQKPLKMFKHLVAAISRETDLILDPFMGSGTTLRAAKDLGRRAIGIEIEEKYCEIAAKRLSQEVLEFT